jgi:hypothetical protein
MRAVAFGTVTLTAAPWLSSTTLKSLNTGS